jgi:serine protease inhibitor
MGAAESDLPDGSVSSSTDPNNPSSAGSHMGAARTTRTHLVYLSRAHNKFAIQLYQEFAKDGKRPGNFVVCPIGMSLGLGVIYVGARGCTQDELHKVLHLQEVRNCCSFDFHRRCILIITTSQRALSS